MDKRQDYLLFSKWQTGPCCFLPDDSGLLRFRNFDEAVKSIEKVAVDFENQCKYACKLAEEYFDARNVTTSILERTLN